MHWSWLAGQQGGEEAYAPGLQAAAGASSPHPSPHKAGCLSASARPNSPAGASESGSPSFRSQPWTERSSHLTYGRQQVRQPLIRKSGRKVLQKAGGHGHRSPRRAAAAAAADAGAGQAQGGRGGGGCIQAVQQLQRASLAGLRWLQGEAACGGQVTGCCKCAQFGRLLLHRSRQAGTMQGGRCCPQHATTSSRKLQHNGSLVGTFPASA